LAAGLAVGGKKPVVAIYSTFLQRAYDQIVQDVCLQNLPVVFAVDRGGLVGEDGPTHHGAFDLSFLRVIPNLNVFVPKDEAELQRLLATALAIDGPSVSRYPRSAGVSATLQRPLKPINGPWIETLRQGSDVAILALGPGVQLAVEAAEVLSAGGFEATVANVRRLHPLDAADVLAVVDGCRAVVTVEDNALAGGFGSAVLEVLADEGALLPVGRVGLPDQFVPHGALDVLRREVGLTPEQVAATAVRLLDTARKTAE
jgi:1-deoxy-D-xylulose-5-phosphate synthase